MKITLTKEKAVIKAVVDFEEKEWADAQEKAVIKLGNNITVPGFRKGHAPYDKIKGLVDPKRVFETAVDIILPKGYKQILDENKDIRVMMQPNVNVEKMSDKELTVSYVITPRPEVKLGQYIDLQIKKEAAIVSEDEINAEIEKIRQNNAEVSVKESGVIEKGDIVNFDFDGYVDGKQFDGGKAEKYDLEIGSNRFVPGFEDQMIGMKKGQKGEVNITFPKDYVKDLASKKATFKVTINEVSVKKIPEINDDLALDANIEGVNNLIDLKNHISQDLSKRKQAEVEHKAQDALIDKIVDSSEVIVPDTLVESELPAEFENYKKGVEARGIPFDKYLEITNMTEEKIKEQMKETLAKNLKVMFVLTTIAEENKITVTEEDLNNEIENIAKQYGMDVKKVKSVMKDRMNELANQIYSRKISDYIISVNHID